MLDKIRQFLSKISFSAPNPDKPSWFMKHRTLLIRLSLVVFISYLLGSSASVVFLPSIIKVIASAKNIEGGGGASVSIKNSVNYHDIKTAVMDRNLFNLQGKFPDEPDLDAKDKGGKAVFDIGAPCEKTNLKIKLVGMISIEGQGSLATIKEDGFDSSDIYAQGDYIIGEDNAQIALIERGKVIINNGGRKECLQIDVGEENEIKEQKPSAPPKPTGPEIFTVDLDFKFVQSELGEGFGKVIQSARLVPNIVNNQVNGFKIFAIQSGTVLEKMGFKENDVITKVNNIVMEAEQGFALYQALNDEKQLRINVLRNGTDPKTIVANIK